MSKARRQWSVEEKLSIVLECLKGSSSVLGVARDYGIDENQVYKWKASFIEQGKQGLQGKGAKVDQGLISENTRLKELVGEQALQIQLLKKMQAR
ncbi:MAG: transposase [Deinococcales bacterium]